VRKFLSVVPRKFVQIASSMETMMDPSTMTIEEVVDHLCAVKERLEGDPSGTTVGSQEEAIRGGAPTGKVKGKAGPSHQGGASPPAAGGDVPKDRCRYCGNKGHWARECRKKQRDEAAAGCSPRMRRTRAQP
jgi:hypothetical protein